MLEKCDLERNVRCISQKAQFSKTNKQGELSLVAVFCYEPLILFQGLEPDTGKTEIDHNAISFNHWFWY